MIDKPTIIMAVSLVLLTVIEFFWAPHYSPKFPWHHVPGFSALIGLISCIVVVLASKWLGKKLLQRPEVTGD